MKILVVEDEKNTQNALVDCIRNFGMAFDNILVAENGTQAYAVFEREKPQIIITDIRMPGGSGLELAGRIYERDRNVAIIFLTAYSEMELMKKAIHVNAVDYILKPVSPEELELAIRKAIEKTDSFVRKNTSLLQGVFFHNLLLNKHAYTLKEFRQIQRELGFPTEKIQYRLLAVENINVDKYWTFENPKYASLNLTPFGKMLGREIGEIPFRYSFVHHKGRILNVCGFDEETTEEAIEELAIHLGDLIYEEYFEKAVIKLGRPQHELFRLRDEESEYREIKLSCEVPILSGRGSITNKSRYIVESIHQVIAVNYKDPMFKVNHIADELCYTSAYLCMVYKKVTGSTINDYLNSYRIGKSERLLRDSTMKLAEIAAKVGYSNENYFSKVFKKHKGISPKEYRTQSYRA